MTLEELFAKATRFNFEMGITLEKDLTYYEDGVWSFHKADLILHRQFGWLPVSKAGLSGTHFQTALEAADFLEQFRPN
jgi:hypothetical protein